MIINKRFVASTIATGALILSSFSTTAFAATVQVSGNGSGSDNNVQLNNTQSNTVVQNNSANITNTITSNSSTGNNNANDNTGGDVTIDTGNASTRTVVDNKANLNRADVNSCGCATATDVAIVGNGSDSNNKVKVNASQDNSIYQTNDALFNNQVTSNANTGGNDANRNTGGLGGAAVTVITGHAANDTSVSNEANVNAARIGGRSSDGSSVGSNSIVILGNGSDSRNHVYSDNSNSASVVQANSADFSNVISNNAKTGHNNANDNTGADVVVDTGNALSKTMVDNAANFNFADVNNCGCTTDSLLKEAGNGSDSNNKINSDLSNTLSLFQDQNNADFSNSVSSDQKTGSNNARRDTGPVIGGDPIDVITGHSSSDTEVSNSSNVNVFGSNVSLPGPGGLTLDLGFDLGSFFSL